MIVAGDSSQAPAFGLAGVLVGSVILLVGAAWTWRSGRGARGVTTWASVAGLTGLAAALLTLFVAGMQHYGGSIDSGDGDLQSKCSVWWTEAGLPSGQKAVEGDLSPRCHHDAIAAIGPALLVALVIGLAVAVVAFGLLLMLRRRRIRRGPRARPDHGAVIE